jgi:hypothetical protein
MWGMGLSNSNSDPFCRLELMTDLLDPFWIGMSGGHWVVFDLVANTETNAVRGSEPSRVEAEFLKGTDNRESSITSS